MKIPKIGQILKKKNKKVAVMSSSCSEYKVLKKY